MIRLQGHEPPPNPPKRSIDWEIYLNSSYVTLKEAVALTCGLSPLEIFDVQRPLVFKHRLEIAQKNLRGSQTIELIEESENLEFSKVSLASIAQFSKEMFWSIPMEMEILIGSTKHHKTQRHVLASKDKHPMDYPIRTAYERAPEPKSNSITWAVLRELALASNPTRPLLDFKDGKAPAIIYEGLDGKPHTYTYKNFTDKMARLRNESN